MLFLHTWLLSPWPSCQAQLACFVSLVSSLVWQDTSSHTSTRVSWCLGLPWEQRTTVHLVLWSTCWNVSLIPGLGT